MPPKLACSILSMCLLGLLNTLSIAGTFPEQLQLCSCSRLSILLWSDRASSNASFLKNSSHCLPTFSSIPTSHILAPHHFYFVEGSLLSYLYPNLRLGSERDQRTPDLPSVSASAHRISPGWGRSLCPHCSLTPCPWWKTLFLLQNKSFSPPAALCCLCFSPEWADCGGGRHRKSTPLRGEDLQALGAFVI